MFHDSKEGQTHYFGDGCIPAHEPIGEKPWEIWEERFDKEFDDITHLDCDGVKDGIKCETMANDVKSFIASEIQSAVEAERRRISEEVGKMYDRCTDWDALKEILSIIDTKK